MNERRSVRGLGVLAFFACFGPVAMALLLLPVPAMFGVQSAAYWATAGVARCGKRDPMEP